MNRTDRRNYHLRAAAHAWAFERLEGRILLATYPLTAIPALNSDPGAPHAIYLDFVGAPPGTFGNESVPATPAYDIDGDPTTFSDQELANIREIWARVAEKYSPFNVNVTTVDPGITNHDQVVRQIIGGNGSWTGTTVGGYTGNGVFEGTSSNCSYIFSENFGGDPHDLGEVCAHEEALDLGLYEQEAWNGNTFVGQYNYGNNLVAPILGSSYDAQRGIWWEGPTYSATAIQDDVAVLTSVLGLRPLTVGQSAVSATPLAVSNNNFTAASIIESLSQGDYYSLNIPSVGSDTFTVNVAPYGPTLHAQLQLLNANGNVVVTANNANTLGQTITATLAAGNYYLVVKSYGQYGDLGQYTLTGTLAAGQATPTFTISGPSSINEGASYSLNLSATDPGQTVNSWVINWGDGNVQTVNGNPSTVSHTYAVGPNSYSISAAATDGTGTYNASGTQAVSVLHVAPNATISGASSVNELVAYTLNLSVLDPNHTILSWAINWGDGTAIQTVSGDPPSVTHTFASGPHSYTISATVTDDVGTYNAAATQAVSVLHVAPVVSIAGPGSVNEQSTYTLSLSASDPGHTILSWSINWGDGTAVQVVSGNPSSVTHSFAAGPNSDTISANLTDDVGTYSASSTQAVSVLHVPPTLGISGPSTVMAGALYTLNLSASDPGHTISSWAINWGDGSAVQNLSGNPSSVTHVFASGPASCTISATATDNVSTYSAASAVAVSVQATGNNPVFTISGLSAVNEQSTYTLNLSASDPGHTVSSWSINWGDGSAVQFVSGNPSGVTHVFALGPNSYSITATATDDTGTYAAGNAQVIVVQHVPPTAVISGAGSVTLPSLYTLNLAASDPGHTVSSWSINWGDGSAAQVVGNVASATHAYASAGNYQITASVTDDVGAYPANSLGVQVNPIPDTTPPTALASLGSVPSNNSFTVIYSDNTAINLATLGNANIRITGPNGFSELAALAGTSVTTNAPTITAAYLITPPGGAWTYTADGTYTVSMVANSVTDISGNAVPAQTLGTFTINITPPSIVSKGHHTKSGTLPAKGAATYVSFTLAAPAMTTLQLSTSQPGITLELLDANLNTIAGKSGKKSVSFAQPLKAGTYYVRVTYSGAKAMSYQFGLTTKALTVAQQKKLAL